MIGQSQITAALYSLKKQNALPRFLILLGDKHSGKAFYAGRLAHGVFDAQVAVTEPTIEGVRGVIDAAYKAVLPTVYIFPDADQMSTAALNAMLKVTEEPPRAAYFILTASTPLLSTLHSRAMVMWMQPYSQDDLRAFTSNEDLLRVAATPGQVQLLKEQMDLIPFAEKVLSTIHTVTGVNSLKIPGYFKYKEGDEGYDLDMFFLCMMAAALDQCVASEVEHTAKMLHVCSICAEYKNKITRKGVNKQALMDMWVFKMREVLDDGETDD